MTPNDTSAPRIAVVGRGVVGERIMRRLPSALASVDLVNVDARRFRLPGPGLDLAILTHGGAHLDTAVRFLDAGVAVLSISDEIDDVRSLTELDERAIGAGVSLVVGAGMSPGLTELMARLLTSQLASCDEIHLSFHGTAGPACARRLHGSLRGLATSFHDGAWMHRPAGSGRELCYFPEPVGPYDCYRADVSSPLLLHESFPDVERISARVSANRRDRFTAWLPMLSPPHREGGVGAVRVEVRGSDHAGGRSTLIAGVAELVGTATAATAIAFAVAALRGELPTGVVRAGDASLDTNALLQTISSMGVRLQEFTGVASERRVSANP